jgi:MFS family permease
VSRLHYLLGRWRDWIVRFVQPGEISEQNNNWNLYREIAWFGQLSAVTNTFVSVFALRLGASSLLMGLRTALPALINVLVQVPAARLVEREADRRRVLLLWQFLMRLPVLLMVLAPLLPQPWRAGFVVYLAVAGAIPTAVATVSFTSLFGDVVAPKDRAHVVSMRNASLAAATTLTLLLTGQVLDILPFPLGYQAVFALAFAASSVSLCYLARVVFPKGEGAELETGQPRQPLNLLRSVRNLLAQPDFSRFTAAAFVFHWGLYFPIPLYPIYRVRTLGLSEGWIGALSMFESAVTIVAYFAWARLAQRHSSRFTLLVGVLLVSFFPIGTALSSSPWPLLVVAAVAGLASPAFNLGLFNGLLEVAPAERRATFVAVFNMLMNVAAFVSPLLGTVVADWLGIRQALMIGGALRVAGVMATACLLYGPSAPQRMVRRLRR